MSQPREGMVRMRSVAEALALICSSVKPRPAQVTSLLESMGQTLAEDIVSDLDSPPFDKSLVDGYALRASDDGTGTRSFFVIEEITAGQMPLREITPGTAARVMTGAPMPSGADAVVPIERTALDSMTERVTILSEAQLKPGTNVGKRGTAMQRGELVLREGRAIRPQEVALLAELGQSWVKVVPRPTISLLSTGDELVSIEETPSGAQIRNSNQSMLAAQVQLLGATPIVHGIARDNLDELRHKIGRALQADILCLTGGVSAGKLDLVPQVLKELGVKELFHKIHMRPGKPLWYGYLPPERTADNLPRWIFGLPGNPVSSMVCFEVFVRTAVRRLLNLSPAEPVPWLAELESDFQFSDPRPTYLPARMEAQGTGWRVKPVDWKGSFDLKSTASSNALMVLPAGPNDLVRGALVEVVPFTGWIGAA